MGGESVYELHDLKPGELDIKISRSVKVSNINATVKLQKSAIGIGADFHVTFHCDFMCMRCLQWFASDFDFMLRLDYIAGEDPYMRIENVELGGHDADRVYYRGPHIDLSVGIREAIVLSQPITLVCKQDCQGLCPECGANLNLKRCACRKTSVGLFTPQSDSSKK